MLIVSAATRPAAACACCTHTGQRYVEVEKLDPVRRAHMEQARFAPEAKFYVGEAGLETISGSDGPSQRYGLKVSWDSDRIVFALDDGQRHAGSLSLAIPPKISIFEVDPRDRSDHGHGPVLYKEWKLTGKGRGHRGLWQSFRWGQLLTLIRHRLHDGGSFRSLDAGPGGPASKLLALRRPGENPMSAESLGPGDRRLRTCVLLVVAAQGLFLIFLTVFLFNQADGMEMVGVVAAFMFIFLPVSLPAFVLAKEGRYLIGAALLAGIAAFLYFAIWLQLLDELGLQQAPWS
ncbi:MAG: hypothetical protein ACREDO_04225 [Methyloceanibacter sp.]